MNSQVISSLLLPTNPTRDEVNRALRQTALHSGEQTWAAGAIDRLLGRPPSNSARNFQGESVTDEMNRKVPNIEIGDEKLKFGGHQTIELIPK